MQYEVSPGRFLSYKPHHLSVALTCTLTITAFLWVLDLKRMPIWESWNLLHLPLGCSPGHIGRFWSPIAPQPSSPLHSEVFPSYPTYQFTPRILRPSSNANLFSSLTRLTFLLIFLVHKMQVILIYTYSLMFIEHLTYAWHHSRYLWFGSEQKMFHIFTELTF